MQQNNKDDDDQWHVVVQKRKYIQKNKKNKHNKKIHQISTLPLHQSLKQMYHQKFNCSKLKIQLAQYLLNILKSKIQMCNNKYKSINLQALGLGNISNSKNAWIQFQVLLYIIQIINKNVLLLINVNVYDPIFDKNSNDMLKQIQKCTQQTLEQTIQNKQQGQLMIWYMPHCQKQLYKTVLQNFGNDIIILGNSLKEYVDRQKLLNQNITKIFVDKDLNQSKLSDFQSAFNDSFIMFN